MAEVMAANSITPISERFLFFIFTLFVKDNFMDNYAKKQLSLS